MFGNSDVSSCRAIYPGKCTACPEGWYKDEGLEGNGGQPCKYCPAGKEVVQPLASSTVGSTECQFCNYAEPVSPSVEGQNVVRRYKSQGGPEYCRDSGLVEKGNPLLYNPTLLNTVSANWPEDLNRRYPRHSIPDSDTGTHCGIKDGVSRRFPNKKRDGCREITNATIQPPPAGGASAHGNYDDVTVTWDFAHVKDQEKDVNVQLCALKFEILEVHSTCDGATEGTTVQRDHWAGCAKYADGQGTILFNFNPSTKDCFAINKEENGASGCASYTFA